MLKNIPAIIPPELLKIMSEMGHGDELVLADGNFPAASHAQRLIRCDALGTVELLDAILSLYPLDTYAERPAAVMQVVKGDQVVPIIWEDYRRLILDHEGITEAFDHEERFAFYERASRAYVIVATGERAQYANLILKKGVIFPDTDPYPQAKKVELN
ncbi:RbsD/FucU family protein [Paenibacillus taichungensis]|uniref:RbsD/FucU family protein n=1 Tax=Paenibacillus taichungensis TaxID=484184 RepID=UPI0028720063|nr:RbsD/FucU domain-containing protein [Paenibacillus taichungensis]MDR9744974.1 RbsD/FucU domain-containing protein [Paenibacillus taichungensis]